MFKFLCRYSEYGIKELIISYGKFHKVNKSDAMSRYIKGEVLHVRIDTAYRGHSYSLASSSKAKDVGILVNKALRRGCRKNGTLLKTFYSKDAINVYKDTMDVLKRRRNNSEKQPCFGNSFFQLESRKKMT